MAKTKRPSPEPTDLTLRNLRALKEKLAGLDERLKAVEEAVKPKSAKSMMDWLR